MKLSSTRRIRPTLKMRRYLLSFVLRAAALLLAIAAAPLHAQDSDDGLLRRGPGPHGQRPFQPTPQQSALPPTQPTAPPTPAQQPPPATGAASDGPTVLHAPATHRAFVIFANGQLEVRADNSSLLQILHDIYRLTGMTITGGVAEQHIFGDYGPAAPSTVLATLLDGTGTNMLLSQDPVTGAPVELVLSQRAGGAPPQSPIGPGFDDSPFPTQPGLPPQPTNSPSQPQPVQPQAAPPVNTVNAVPAPTTAPPASPAKAAGPATPESIYQQLLQMQAARSKATPTSPSPANTPPTTPASSPAAPK